VAVEASAAWSEGGGDESGQGLSERTNVTALAGTYVVVVRDFVGRGTGLDSRDFMERNPAVSGRESGARLFTLRQDRSALAWTQAASGLAALAITRIDRHLSSAVWPST